VRTRGTLRSGELARLTGVSTDTLRVYERRGLLSKPRRSANGYREYPPEAHVRVRLVQRALAIGFTLDELPQVFNVVDIPLDGGSGWESDFRAVLIGLKLLETQKRQTRQTLPIAL
jgi:DNA-binding transcriptional MerR regulator